MSRDDDEARYGGFDEAENEFDRQARIKAMGDTALLNAYNALSNPRVLKNTDDILSALEAELRERGLLSSH